jgi:cyclin-dependent kinase 7
MSPPSVKHRYSKEQKVGEGQYAIVYLGKQSGTNRRVAIKSIKIGQFKDGRGPRWHLGLTLGMDMSAIREIKYLQELRHQNITEVCLLD